MPYIPGPNKGRGTGESRWAFNASTLGHSATAYRVGNGGTRTKLRMRSG